MSIPMLLFWTIKVSFNLILAGTAISDIINDFSKTKTMTKEYAIKKVKEICNNIQYSRDIPQEAKEIAAANSIIVVVGGSDDLMYCYGADCYLTNRCEHGYGWDGDTLEGIQDKLLEKEANQLGLMIWWCGKISGTNLLVENYDVDKSGAFSYSVKPEITALDFTVLEDDEVYCTGKVIALPDGFIKSK